MSDLPTFDHLDIRPIQYPFYLSILTGFLTDQFDVV